MIEMPKSPTREQALAIADHIDRPRRTSGLAFQRPAFRNRLMAMGYAIHGAYGYEITPAGHNAIGRAAPGQSWGDWTVAWRARRATTVKRCVNWAGSWAEAAEMAQAVGELLGDGYQVWYVQTAATEAVDRQRIADGVLDAAYAEDHGSIMGEGSSRIRMTENGMLPAELLDREVENVTHAMRLTSAGTRTLAEYRALAVRGKAEYAADWWASAVKWSGDADKRRDASYYSQPWAARDEPQLARKVLTEAAERLRLVAEVIADIEGMAAGFGQPEGLLGAESGDLVADAAAQGLTLDVEATRRAGEPVFAAQTHCGTAWVAEIAKCPRCGLDASQHPVRSTV